MSSDALTLAPAPRSDAAEQVRAEVREFLAAELAAGTFSTHVDTWLSGVDPEFSRKLGERGWLGMTWPKEYGGHERTAMERYAVTEELLAAGAPVAAFGVGTALAVGAGGVAQGVEGGALGGVYKEVAYVDESGATVPKVKVAGDKTTLPGPKEVYRVGEFVEDVVQLADEPRPADDAERLLKPVVRDGRIVAGSLPPLSEIWELASRNLARLPDRYRQLVAPDPYPVRFSPALCELRDAAIAAHEQGRGSGVDDGGGASEPRAP